ncbi:hypothetical protein MLD38_018300 [Melastoma candidum]|uniref:Uncharacterized protein n=1 Tax=Melastoma candidum TaxID=119954 RepID=A0ACB9QWJ2_9MYRT|nr:hypothetical protein MLD38_018300 [Melastoma candidum]
MDRPWAFHIECVLPELRTVYMNIRNPVIKRLEEEITRKEEEARDMKEKLEKIMLELDELRKKHADLISEEEKNISGSL